MTDRVTMVRQQVERDKKIQKLRQSGLSHSVIAARLGLSRERVREICARQYASTVKT